MTPTGSISDILSQKGSTVHSVSPENTVYEAISMMAEKNVGALLVIDKSRLVGILSERDYTRKVALRGKTSKDTPVREILSGKVITAPPDLSIADCMRLMTEHRIRHLPVLEAEKILGIVSIGDLVNWIISEQSSTINQLHTYIAGYPSA
jgi:CBS domain-containing protein